MMYQSSRPVNLICCLLCLINLFFDQASWAKTTEHNAPSTPTIDLAHFVEIGNAEFSFLFWEVYTSRLYTTTGSYPVNLESEQLILDITYLIEIERDDLVKSTIEQWQHLKISEIEYQKYIEPLRSIWPDINANDSLMLHILQNKSVFYFNGESIGEINDQAFGQLFADIWLSENTSEPKLRKQLLGLTNN